MDTLYKSIWIQWFTNDQRACSIWAPAVFSYMFLFFSLFSWPKKMDGTRVSPSLLDQGQAWRLWRLRRRAEFGLKLGLHHVEHGRTHPNPLVSFHLIISYEIPSWMIHWLTVFQIILGVPLTTGTWEPWQDDLCDPRYWKFQEVALQSDGFFMAQLKWVNRCQQFFFRHGSPDITSTKLSHLHLMCTRMHTWNFDKHYSWHSEYSDCPAADICRWHSEVHGFTPKFKVLFKVACRSYESCGICDSVYWIQQGPLSFVDAGCFMMFYDWIYNVVCS